MNENIKRLLVKSNIDIRGHYDESGNTPKQLEEFAILIVKECCQVLKGIPIWELEPHSAIIAKHFGVDLLRKANEK